MCLKAVQFIEKFLRSPTLQLTAEQLHEVPVRKTDRMTRGLKLKVYKCPHELGEYIRETDKFMLALNLSGEKFYEIVQSNEECEDIHCYDFAIPRR